VDSGSEAIARSATERFDMIMMDLNMPMMDGFAATRLIRQREGQGCRVPIIALTAHHANNYRDSCLNAGMDDLMSKPYTLDQCAQLLRRWIGDTVRPPLRGNGGARTSTGPGASADTAAGIQAATEIDATTVMGLKNLRSGGQSDLYSKLVALFRPVSSKAIDELRSALASDDLQTASALCHRLSSSAANVGALAFAQYLRQLEKACQDRDRTRAARLYDTVRAAHPALIDELTRLQLRESA
jgi:CheY-like chemotaxis protein/HPt (histidine-containing phosphotransfer) domain-containing protein